MASARRRNPGGASNVQLAMPPLSEHIDRRSLVFGGVALALLLALVSMPGLLRDLVGEALASLADASPGLLWLAGACFVGVLAALGSAWRAGVRACGGTLDAVDATARYATGSLVSALVPAGAGGAVRIALFSRALPAHERLWQAGGIAAALTAARATTLAVIAAVAAALGAFPSWPIGVLAAVGAAAVCAALLMRRRSAHSRVAHVLDVFAALGRSPACAATLVGWVAAAMLARVGAATCVAAAVGLESPVVAGILAVAALSLAGMIQLTPANMGVSSGALALALHAHGVPGAEALSAGIAFQALETLVAVLVGGVGVVSLARLPVPAWTLRLAGGGAAIAVAGAFSATVLA